MMEKRGGEKPCVQEVADGAEGKTRQRESSNADISTEL